MSSPSDEAQSFDTRAFGERVFQARKALEADARADISKEEMGQRVGVAGATYGRWEKGEDKPNLDRLVALAAVLGVQPAWLAFGVGERDAAQPAPPAQLTPADQTHERPRVRMRSRSEMEATRDRAKRPGGGKGA
jgi:transcriptional regulator with XRE-family HTH domain